MKKWTCLILLCTLCLTLAACAPEEVEMPEETAPNTGIQAPVKAPWKTPSGQEVSQSVDADLDFTAYGLQVAGNGMKTLQQGTLVKFGHYPQKRSDDPIMWLVLSSENGTAVLISQDCLDSLPYHNTQENVDWEHCDLRRWLNSDFLSKAFTSGEQSILLDYESVAHENPKYNTDSGRDVTDTVTILSAEEATDPVSMYSDSLRRSWVTPYSVKHGAYKNGDNQGWWWLRTPASTQDRACSVNSDGSMDYVKGNVTSLHGCVRPVIRVQIP